MSLENLKAKRSEGFTIVELLIVIVIIGVLAAIVIVAYTGITARANTAAAKANAQAIQQLAEVYNADNNGAYPDLAQLNAGTTSATKPTGVTVTSSWPTSSSSTTDIYYLPNGTVGGCIAYWDFSAGARVTIYAGSADTNGTAASCTKS